MTTLNPKSSCVVIRRIVNGYDRFGRELHETIRRKTRCAVVKVGSSADRTTVRNDSSASGGAFEEMVYDARLLFLPSESIQHGDLVELLGLTLQVKVVNPRPDVNGVLHHLQVDLDRWVSE